MAEFDDISLVDGHLHPPLRLPDVQPFVRYFSEAADSDSLERHASHTLFFQRAVMELAAFLGCDPEAPAVQEARQALGMERYLRLLVESANVEALLIDDGYPPEGALTLAEIQDIVKRPARRVLRLESLVETLLPKSQSPNQLMDLMLRELEAQPRPAALKSIIAYRSGLDVREPEPDALGQAFAILHASSAQRPIRLQSKPLLDFCLLRALEWAVDARLPVQFHTGFGDRDLDLPLSNPALLRRVLESPRFEQLQVVLLHASYPYTREAGYLAAVYPQVYVDWSEANPLLSPRELQRVLEELLSLAPYTKLLYGSDAWGIPDWILLAASAGRAALAGAVSEEPKALRTSIARRVLRDNARELYHLGSESSLDARRLGV
jgi:uncharacterized protein